MVKTDITVVLDRSGSMASISNDVIGGLNTFIQAQAQVEGEACFTLAQFDHEYEVVHDHVPVKDVPPLTAQTYVPRGSTALLDAIGRTIVATGARLASMAEADRPQVVLFAVQTDGLENASREFTRQQIFDMIRHQETKYSWQFVFLAADQDAIAEGGKMGFAPAAALDYSKDGTGVAAMFSAMSEKVEEVRSGKAARVAFSQADRARTKRP
jgi:hypothetical protein